MVGAATGPLVVVCGRLTPADADGLAALPAHSAHPVLLSAAPVEDALERAVATGWYAASIAPGVDLRDAWTRVSHADLVSAEFVHGRD
ncbi:hypothetical protein [Microbacterium elymi]|uniref:N-(5'-phosphoribosyl)anthranilate isomerase n=1 Tax=Microbacterium elymi TaxID=2909587 RepID=A0ABY5NNN1_9MICO|nr:hypothetical protein [Microbacterium elymi]UUT36743.1 hypothetical protein L2X98_31810 [Microbacterium elymi]